MSVGNVELLRHMVEVYNERDVEAFIEHCDPGIEWHSAFAPLSGAPYSGHEGIRQWHREMQETWGDQIRVEPEAYFGLGENTLIFAVLHGRGQHSGAQVAMPYALVARWHEDLVVYMKAFTDRDEALS